ncbi:hypothetical protein [Caulobacter sp.]|uniref:hypothetical protein n=1 Tax=Caulobacter sp. TaxID=78 RepID=UPI001B16A2CA|nr:hypothetical protein [Caulobacter sp.]MBO9545821.1 DUF883 family protein [Caulobacter sp.]
MTDYRSADDEAFIGELGGDLGGPLNGAGAKAEAVASFKAAKTSAKAAAASVKEAAGVAIDQARERLRGVAGGAAGEIQHRYGDLEAWVQLKPARALGIAAGVGVLLGLLLRGPTTRVVYLRDH